MLPFSCSLSPWRCKIQSAQPTGTCDAGVLTCVPRCSLVPIMTTGNPAAGKDQFQCRMRKQQTQENSWQPPLASSGAWAHSWGLQPPQQSLLGLISANRPRSVSLASQALGLALLLHMGVILAAVLIWRHSWRCCLPGCSGCFVFRAEQPGHGYQFLLTAVLPIPGSEALRRWHSGFNLQGSCAAVVPSVPVLVFSGLIVQR